MEQPSVHGLEALCALGLIQSDETLATAALLELHKLEETMDQKHRKHVGLLSMGISHLKVDICISMDESNTVVSAYRLVLLSPIDMLSTQNAAKFDL